MTQIYKDYKNNLCPTCLARLKRRSRREISSTEYNNDDIENTPADESVDVVCEVEL